MTGLALFSYHVSHLKKKDKLYDNVQMPYFIIFIWNFGEKQPKKKIINLYGDFFKKSDFNACYSKNLSSSFWVIQIYP